MAAVFVPRLGVPAGRRWLDVGCGTGALTATVLAAADPTTVIGIDPSAGFIGRARAQIADQRARFGVGESDLFRLCRPEPLRNLWADAGLADAEVEAIEVPTVFADFEDFWVPFLGGQGPAAGYAMSLPPDHRVALRNLLRHRLPARPDGTIALTARAWAVRGRRR